MSKPKDDEASLTNTTDEANAEEAGYETRDWLRVAVVVVLATSVVTIGLLQASGVIDLYPSPSEGTAEWIVFGGIVVVALLIGGYVWEFAGETA